MKKSIYILLFVLLAVIPGFAVELTLPTVFSDHMVLQREQPVPVWGKADPGAVVTVTFAGQKKTATADLDGNWSLKLDPLTVSKKSRELRVSAELKSDVASQKFIDVLVGEVWLCSGQSNMQWAMQDVENAEEFIAAANYPEIRLYDTPRVASEKPMGEINAHWKICTPETVRSFSGVAYFFGRKLHEDLEVPVGLLLSAWGGTLIEPWTPPCGYAAVESLSSIHQRVEKTRPTSSFYKQSMAEYQKEIAQWIIESEKAVEAERYIVAPPAFPEELILTGDHQTPTKLYNGMLHAHIPFAIRGAIWYQGEANRNDGMLYLDKTEAMLGGWRKLWGYDFPFYFVQIAPYHYGQEDPGVLATFWETEAEIVKTIPKTGMAIVSDYTDPNDIHPRNKEVPGERLALLAEANDYGMDVVSTGPVFKSLTKKGQSLILQFDSAEGLATRDGNDPDWFEVADESGVFKTASARIHGTTVVVRSMDHTQPVAVRFAWHKLAMPNLINGAGLPAATFRAGELPTPKSVLEALVPEAAGFRVIYQLDIPVEANYAAEAPPYAIDNSATDSAPFNQIAYFLELENRDGTKQYAFASMDRFTDDLKETGIPIHAPFIQKVKNLTVRSNVAGVVPCNSSDGGNIEFFSGNYGPGSDGTIPGGTSQFDFCDTYSGNPHGYGSMQVHNWKEKQTVFAFNHWGANGTVDLGIGNAPSDNLDWTFTQSAKEYTNRRLTILVK